MLEIYFTLLGTTFKETAEVINFSKGFICFLLRKIPLHGINHYILNHREKNCSTN